MRNRRKVNKFANQRHRIGGLFLHQPMSRTCDYFFLHIGRNMTHDHSLLGTEGLLSTNRHHWHRQLRLFEDLIVLRILREGCELREPCPHSTRLRISGSKKNSSCPRRAPRDRRESRSISGQRKFAPPLPPTVPHPVRES